MLVKEAQGAVVHHFILKVFSRVRDLCRALKHTPPYQPWQTMSLGNSLCEKGHCHTGTCLAS